MRGNGTKRGRPKLNFETALGRFPEGTLERIDGVRRADETRTSFFQTAVNNEIARRGGAKSLATALDAPDEG